MLYLDTKTWLPDRLLVKADKMTMANSLELRVPLLDHKVLEFAAGLPDRQKVFLHKTKRILKRAFTRRIPSEILRRRKAGFLTPYELWFSEHRNRVLEILTDRRSIERGYLNPGAVHRLLIEPWKASGQGSTDVFALVVLEIWHRMFIDGGSTASPP